jgi:predicted permease
LENLEREKEQAQEMKYVVAIIGAALVFVGVFFLWGAFINPMLPSIFQSYIHIGAFGTNNLLGVILGLAAAASSFFATLKMKK